MDRLDAMRVLLRVAELAALYRWLPTAVHVHALATLPLASSGKLAYGALLSQLEATSPGAELEASDA